MLKRIIEYGDFEADTRTEFSLDKSSTSHMDMKMPST
jgi:hypothetical protein